MAVGAALALIVGIVAVVGAEAVATAPAASAAVSSATTIAAGANSSCAIRSGKAYCWGDNTYGELGNNSTTSSGTPLAVYTGGALSGVTLTQVAAGASFACALASTGAAYCWGLGTSGQLGSGAATSSSVPVAVSGSLTLSQLTVGSTFA
jgi:alpha-tubulin suppressor-like RCC1 family protein